MIAIPNSATVTQQGASPSRPAAVWLPDDAIDALADLALSLIGDEPPAEAASDS